MGCKAVTAAAVVGVFLTSATFSVAADNKPAPPKTCPEGQQLLQGVCKKVKDYDFCPPEGCLVKPEGSMLGKRRPIDLLATE